MSDSQKNPHSCNIKGGMLKKLVKGNKSTSGTKRNPFKPSKLLVHLCVSDFQFLPSISIMLYLAAYPLFRLLGYPGLLIVSLCLGS